VDDHGVIAVGWTPSGGVRRPCGVAEGEPVLDEDDVVRHEHATGVDVVAPVAEVVRWVADEDASQGPRAELVR
jgi:hypothetical protein